jgi:phosphate transport system ATP-binding protein
MVTHDLAQAARIGDRTAFFFDGRLIEEGPTEQLFLSPKHPETIRYVSGLSVTAGWVAHTRNGGADGGQER